MAFVQSDTMMGNKIQIRTIVASQVATELKKEGQFDRALTTLVKELKTTYEDTDTTLNPNRCVLIHEIAVLCAEPDFIINVCSSSNMSFLSKVANNKTEPKVLRILTTAALSLLYCLLPIPDSFTYCEEVFKLAQRTKKEHRNSLFYVLREGENDNNVSVNTTLVTNVIDRWVDAMELMPINAMKGNCAMYMEETHIKIVKAISEAKDFLDAEKKDEAISTLVTEFKSLKDRYHPSGCLLLQRMLTCYIMKVCEETYLSEDDQEFLRNEANKRTNPKVFRIMITYHLLLIFSKFNMDEAIFWHRECLRLCEQAKEKHRSIMVLYDGPYGDKDEGQIEFAAGEVIDMILMRLPLLPSDNLYPFGTYDEDWKADPDKPKLHFGPCIPKEDVVFMTTYGGQRCDVCSKSPQECGKSFLLRCTKCQRAYYCSKECQKEGQKRGHKAYCQAKDDFRVNDFVKLQTNLIPDFFHDDQIFVLLKKETSTSDNGLEHWTVALPGHGSEVPEHLTLTGIPSNGIRHVRPLK